MKSEIIVLVCMFIVMVALVTFIIADGIHDENVSNKAQITCGYYRKIKHWEHENMILVVCETENGMVVRESK